MKRVISDNDVVVASSDFTAGVAIITTGGLILADNLPTSITRKAAMKRTKRDKKIDSYFITGSYLDSCIMEYKKNCKFMDETLLDLYKELCTSNQEIGISTDIYLTLLDCLIEASQPVKSNHYEVDIEKMKEEHSKILSKEYRKNFER